MMELLSHVIVCLLVALPTAGAAALAISGLFGTRLSERVISGIIGWAYGFTSFVGLIANGFMWFRGTPIRVMLGDWFQVEHYTFAWVLLGDHLSLPFSLFSAVLVGLIAAFSRRYLHREQGYYRFYLLLSVFGAGVQVIVLAGGLDLLVFGWEFVGLTSALLIAFFHERPKPVEHGYRAYVTYRLCDIGLLAAAVWMHHSSGSALFKMPLLGQPWAALPASGESAHIWIVGLLLLWASMGKSAQLPLGGWLPRAMEGPTPSSAIFYGAISIHLGPYLLLRATPILEQEPGLALLVGAVGLLTALHASFVGRVQTDIKSVLAYASMAQVGLIFVEIALGLRFIPLLHIVGHAAVRSLEILRSPNLLQDYRHLELAIGRQVPRSRVHIERIAPEKLRPWLYRHALERGYFDALVRDVAAGSIVRAFRILDYLDRRMTSVIVGRAEKGED